MTGIIERNEKVLRLAFPHEYFDNLSALYNAEVVDCDSFNWVVTLEARLAEMADYLKLEMESEEDFWELLEYFYNTREDILNMEAFGDELDDLSILAFDDIEQTPYDYTQFDGFEVDMVVTSHFRELCKLLILKPEDFFACLRDEYYVIPEFVEAYKDVQILSNIFSDLIDFFNEDTTAVREWLITYDEPLNNVPFRLLQQKEYAIVDERISQLYKEGY